MALSTVNLDDLRWADMVTLVRRRIAAASAGQWTLHAPVDPGVTLLELFSWVLEQRVYWMNQVPDSLLYAMLRLLDEKVTSATSASTVLMFNAPNRFRILKSGRTLSLAGRVSPLIFSTQQEIVLLPIDELPTAEHERGHQRIFLFVEGKDRTQDLSNSRAVPLFSNDATELNVEIILWLSRKFPAPPRDAPFSLLFDLDSPSSIAPHWSNEAVKDVQPPAKLRWLYLNGSGEKVEFPTNKVEDGTGGLRRSGIVRLPIPTDWAPTKIAAPVNGLIGYPIYLKVAVPTYTSAPRLLRLIANTAIAHHIRFTRNHSIEREWLPLPGNRILLSELAPQKCKGSGLVYVDLPPMEDFVELSLRERKEWKQWEATQDLSFHGPAERVFKVDRKRGEIQFGDGLSGRVPVVSKKSKRNIRVRYAVGAGAEGNLGSNLSWEGCNAKKLKATNVVEARGGAETESVAAACARVAGKLRERTRAVTKDDFERIACTTPGVAIRRAHAAIGYHPNFPCTPVAGAVTILIVPHAPRIRTEEEHDYVIAPMPDPGALATVRKRLDETRLVTSEVYVRPARYRSVSLRIEITAEPLDPLGLRSKVTNHLQDFLDPLIGGDEKEGWPFGEPLRPSVLMREAQKAAEDSGLITSIYIGVDGKAPAEKCNDIKIGPHDLVALMEVVLRIQSSVLPSGGLR